MNFKDAKVQGLDALEELDKDSALVYVSSHKSHFDYWIIPFHLCQRNLKVPAIASGDNLFISVIGWYFRKLKAIKLKRGADAEDLRQFFNYIKEVLIPEKEPLLFFPEYSRGKNRKIKTGRSYDGKLHNFAPNFLNPLIEAKKCNNHAQIYVVPTAVSYSRVPEDTSFPYLGRSKSRNKFIFKDLPHIFAQLLFNSRASYQLNFGEPIPIEKDSGLTLTSRIRKEIGKLYTVFPSALLAQAIMQTGKSDVSYAELEDAINTVHSKLTENGATFSDTCSDMDRLLHDAKESLRSSDRRIVLFNQNGVSVRKPEIVEYYANTIKHLVA